MSKMLRVVSLVLAFGVLPPTMAQKKSSDASVSGIPMEQLKAFAETYWQIKRNYVDQVDDKQLLEGAINGMLKSLDSYSGYLNEEDLQDLQVSSEGFYDGLGVEVVAENKSIRVVSIISNSPAERAGIQKDDIIVAVDHKRVDEEGPELVIDSMRGVAGESVELEILAQGKGEPVIHRLTRETLELKSIAVEEMAEGVWHVSIKMFQRDTGYELEKELLAAARDKPINGMILDLRNNPGGVLKAAVDVVDLMLDSGIIVSTEGRTRESFQKYFANPGDVLEQVPLVVLINENSASASEIVAGALQDHKRGVILGSPSYGKGVVQSIMPLQQNAAIKLTTSRYLTPTGRSIHGKGIQPDIAVSAEDVEKEAEDRVLTTAHRTLVKKLPQSLAKLP